MSDDDRVGHIPSDDELAAARARVEALLHAVDLGESALWIDPAADLEDRVVARLAESDLPRVNVSVLSSTPQSSAPRLSAPRQRRRWVAPVAAAVLAVVAIVTLRSPDPDWVVALGATEQAPGVTASVMGWNEAAGTRVELDIDGLPAAPDGYVYELWFSAGAVHVSAGTFHAVNDVTLSVGVSRADYPRLWITLERLDDDPGPGLNLLDTNISP